MRLCTVLAFAATALIVGPARAQQAPQAHLNQITAVRLTPEGSVVVDCADKPNFTTFTLSAPPRLVLDFADTVLLEPAHELAVGKGGLVAVRTAAFHSDTATVARVILTLEPEAQTDLTSGPGQSLKIAVTPLGSAPVLAVRDVVAEPQPPAPKPEPKVKPVDDAAVKQAEADRQARDAALAQAKKDAEARVAAEAQAKAAEARVRALEAEAAASKKAEAERQAKAEQARLAEQDAARKRAAELAEQAREAAKVKAEQAQLAQQEAERKRAAEVAEAERAAKAKQAEQARVAEQEAARKRTAELAEKAKQEASARRKAQALAEAQTAERDRQSQLAEARKREAMRAQVEAERRAEAAHLQAQREAEARAARAQVPATVHLAAARAPEPEAATVRGPLKDVTLVGYRQTATGSRVFVRTSDTVKYAVSQVDAHTLVLEIENARISQRNSERPLDTSFFPGAVLLISPTEDRARHSVRVVIKLRAEVPYDTKLEGNDLAVDFQRPDSE